MKTLDGKVLKSMYISGANNLYNHYPEVDRLNVFPIPDGDTGMNMNLTVTSGMKEIQNKVDDDLSSIASSFASGLMMGSRGNSGVITYQIFKGFALYVQGKKSINAVDLAKAFVSAKETAYKQVTKPVEGTILTVIREASSSLVEYVKNSTSIEDAMDAFYGFAQTSLEHTPDLLPVLKEVGVVDSGGAGLVRIIEGMVSAVHGKVIERNQDVSSGDNTQVEVPLYAGAKLTEDEEGYGYCTQFLIRLAPEGSGKKTFNETSFTRFLSTHGKSVVTAREGDIVKVHVHTLTPGNMLNYAQQFGEFVTITIENMSEEHHNIEAGKRATDYSLQPNSSSNNEELEYVPENEFGLVSVSSGEGLDELFSELGVNVVVSGGQTMNPSTEDFVVAIKKAKAKTVFVLPNNSNIVMAATTACEVATKEGKIKAKVIPSKTIPQGIAACLMYNPESDSPSTVYNDMKKALKTVKSGSVTYSIKDTEIDGVHITKGHYMAMKEKNIVSCVKDKTEALTDLIDSLINKNSSLLTVYCGEDVKGDELESITELLTKNYGDEVDVEVRSGKQPVYSFLVGVE